MISFLKNFRLTLAIGFVCLTFVLILSSRPFYLELKSYDLWLSLRGTQPPPSDIVLVTIDEQTYKSLDQQFPYPRNYHAQIIANLIRAKAKLIVFDMEFDTHSSDDVEFAAEIKRAGNVILSAKLDVEKQDSLLIQRFIKPVPLLSQSCKGIGIVGVKKDRDNFLREYLFWQEMKNIPGRHPSLALTTVNHLYKSINKDTITFSQPEITYQWKSLPTVGCNAFLINYAGPAHHFKKYSYDIVLDDSTFQLPANDCNSFEELLKHEVFKDKIVIVGVSVYELGDHHLTPYSSFSDRPEMPGIEVHANAINTLLSQNIITRPDFYSRLLLLLFLTIFAALLVIIKPPFNQLALLGLVVIYSGFAWFLFVYGNLWLDLISPLFQILLLDFAVTIYYHRVEARHRKKLSRYLPQYILDKLEHPAQQLSIGGQRKELTLLFCDIRGFTSWAEKQEPEDMVKMINEFFDEMADSIALYDGCVKDFIGDGVFAFYGDPIEKDHALNAVNSALEMLERFNLLCQKWRGEGYSLQVEKERSSIGLAVGINTGFVTVGNFGFKSIKKMTYSVIGNHVNLASRIVDIAGAGQILISERTKSLVNEHFDVQRLQSFVIKGKRDPVVLYEVIIKNKTTKKML